MTSQDLTLFAIKALFAVAAVALMVIFLVRPVLRVLFTQPDLLEYTQTAASRDAFEEEPEIPIGDGKPDRSTVIEEARADPRRTAALVSAWLKDRR